MSGRERPLATVPGWLWALLGATLAAQLGAQALRPPPAAAASDLPPAPGEYGAAVGALILYAGLLCAAGLFDFHRRNL